MAENILNQEIDPTMPVADRQALVADVLAQKENPDFDASALGPDPWNKLGIDEYQYADLVAKGLLPAHLMVATANANRQAERDARTKPMAVKAEGAWGLDATNKIARMQQQGVPRNVAENYVLAQSGVPATSPVVRSTGEQVDPSELTPEQRTADPSEDPNVAAAMRYQNLMRDRTSGPMARIKEAMNRQAEINASQSEAQVKLLEAQNKVIAQSQAKSIEVAENRDSAAQEYQRQRADLEQKLLNTEIDAGRFWANKSTGEKVTAGLAIFLGGFSANMQGRQNTALANINRAIDRDIEEQKQNYNIKSQEIQRKDTAFAQAMRIFDNQEAAAAAVRHAALEKTKNQLVELEARTSPDRVRTQTQQAIAQLEYQQGLEQEKMNQALAGKIADKAAKESELFVPGFGVARNEKAWGIMAEAAQEYNDGKQSAQRVLSILEKYAYVENWKPNSEERDQLKTGFNAIRGKLRVPIIGTGPVSETEWEILMDTIVDGTGKNPLKRRESMNKLREIMHYANINIESKAGQYVRDYKPKNTKEFKDTITPTKRADE